MSGKGGTLMTNATTGRRSIQWLVAVASLLVATFAAAGPTTVEAGVFFNDTQYTYKEYWASHSTYTAGCGADATSGGSWYIEPAGCAKSIDLEIGDDISGAIAAVVYVDLWRNRVSQSARFTINSGPQITPQVGDTFSRTPFSATVPLTQLQTGTNVFRFQESTGPYHVHDVMIRVYYDASKPIVAGPGSDVTPPTGQLTSVGIPGGPTLSPTTGGTLAVDANQITLTATATDAKYVEFHAYYDGFDEDNDGITRDWHNFLRNNYGPGGVEAKANGATIGHIGTDSTAPYQVTWNLPDVVSQSGVKFKIRVVDQNGNVVEAPGGASADFTLTRSYSVESYTIPDFQDQALYFDAAFPLAATDQIQLPTDLNGATRALLIGNYWSNPDISINNRPPVRAFAGTADTWDSSTIELPPSALRPGSNSITWTYHPPGFGAMIERPGPMIVIHRTLPTGGPVITTNPADVYTSVGLSATFNVTASGQAGLVYQWLRDGAPIPGATSTTYTTPALSAADNNAKFSVRVTNSLNTVTSPEATVYVRPAPVDTAPWWNEDFDFRVPLTVSPDPVARTDKVVSQQLNFSSLMASAGAGGPTFDPNSIRVVEVDNAGVVTDPSVAYQFDPSSSYDAMSNATGTLVWQLEGDTTPGVSRSYFVYFDKTSKAHTAPVFPKQLTRSVTTDEGFPAYRFDLADGSQWFYHTSDGGGFSSIVDRNGRDWLGWSTATGSLGDFRGFPNSTKPPLGYFHPGRPGTTVTTLLNEGPLRVTFETRSPDSTWIAVWSIYPTYTEFEMKRANTNYWVLYEGLPGGEFDAGDFIQRSDGVQVASSGTFESDIAGDEWMYAADPADNRSFFMAHGQDDGSVESYRQLDNRMTVLGFGRGGTSLNFPYLQKLHDGKPQTFAAGLADSVDPSTTGAHIVESYKAPSIAVGSSSSRGAATTGPVSDGFNGSVLDPMWTFVDPVGGASVAMRGTAVEMTIPAGPAYDLWTGRNSAPRLMQTVENTDFDVAVGFDSVPTLQSQGQGLLFWQDQSNWVRSTIVFKSGSTKVEVYKMVNGTASQIFTWTMPGVSLTHLRATRSGDTWQFRRSWNGQTWFNAGSFTIPLDVNEVGVYATSYKPPASPGFVSTVAYFQNRLSGPPVDSGPKISNVTVDTSGRGAVVSWTTDTAASTRLDHGPTVELGQVDVDPTLSTTHSVTIRYLKCESPYFVRTQSTDANGTTVGQIVQITTDACPPIVSDDFSAASLGGHWEVVDPVGDALVSKTSTNVIVSLPAGSSHNLFPGQNFATRLRQEGPAGNFGVEAKFESVLTSRFQMQGIVVEQDDNSYLRFEIHHDGTNVKAYVASILDDVATVQYYGNLPVSAEHYMRVQRSGDTWTMTHSIDDLTWSPVGVPFAAEIEAAYVGPYIGTTSTGTAVPPAFIGSIDYFFNVDTPIDPDDGGVGPDEQPPVLANVAAASGVPAPGQATVTWTTDEPATTRVDWGPTLDYGSTPVIDNVAVFGHSAILGPLNCGVTYNFRAVSRDASGNEAASPNQTFTTPACPAGAFSDNFDAPVIDSRWYVEDTTASGTITPLAGLLSMSIPGGQRHDLTTANRGAVRLLQPVDNSDFQVQVGFESVVNFSSQIQGVVFEQSSTTLVRFDLFSDGATTRAFVGDLNPTRLQTRANVVVNGAVPGTLRVTRTGDNWLFEYSANDGATWQTIFQGTIGLTVSRMGPMVGNANTQIANVPEHTAFVDYFWSNANPISITEPGLTNGPMFTIFGGNGLVWDGSPLDFGAPGLTQPDVNVLGRVLDPDGVTSITYRVNGGAPVRMGLGSTNCDVGISCTRRLASNGDFNADINASLLTPGINTVSIRAVDGAFNVSTIDVPVNYTPALQFPLPYSVDWNASPDVYERSQAIDGRWVREGDTIRTREIGYDRLLAVGDGNWESFEAEVPITINSVDLAGYAFPSGGPGIGFIPHWMGHTQSGIVQPKFGFQGRLGALVWYRYRNDANAERFEIRDSQAALVAEDLTGRRLSVGTTYIYKLQAQTGTSTTGPSYRLKVWEAGTTEPFAWDIQSSLPVGSPDQGSLALVAHHVDATFGDVQVRDLSAVPPLVSPTSGTYSGLTTVSMASDLAGATIRYTLDGSEPTAASQAYTNPFLLTATTTVKAKVFRSGFDPSPTTTRVYEIVPAAVNRVTAGVRAEYRFEEGSGTTVRNSVPGGSALHLTIQSGSNVTWLGSQDGLRLNGPSLIRTAAGARPLNDAIRNSQSMTVEMWVDPANLNSGERTLLQLAPSGTGNQNLSLAQSASSLQTALRTATTNSMGEPVQTASGAIRDGMHQVVYVRRPSGVVEVYVDGSQVWSGTRAGSLSTWASGYALAIGNNIARTSPWTGDLFLMAVYDDDLSLTQIGQNFLAGVLPPSSNQPPTANAGPDQTVIQGSQATMAATATDDGLPAPPASLTRTWSQVSGPATAVFANPASATSTVTLPAVGVYTLRWTVSDGERTTIDEVQVTVLSSTSPAPPPQITPNGGSHAGPVDVSISSSLANSEIRYTLDGSDPSATSTRYVSPIRLTATTTVKARVFATGLGPSTVTSADFVIGAAQRVSAGLLALYPFNETAGAIVRNVGPLGSAIDLTIGDTSRTTRVPSGLRLDQGTVLASPTATALNTAITSANAFTTELWIDPATSGQLNAMLLGLSVNSNARNLGIVQEATVLDGYLRTGATNLLGQPPTQAVGQVLAGPTHVVFTRTPQGATTLYVNGAAVATGTRAKTLGNWASTARLHLGGERDGSKPWLGTYRLVAMYNRALTPEEVLQNFVVGDV